MKKLTKKKVQDTFNEAIRKRDGRCTYDLPHNCSASLQCSHFFPIGSNDALRFYPPNAWTQCAAIHMEHHNRNPLVYVRWMEENFASSLEYMESVRKRTVKYSQPVLKDIYALCREGKIEALTAYIENLLN